MEETNFEIPTLNDIQKKIDKMPFMLVLVVCSLCIITFFICNLFVNMQIRDSVKENIEYTKDAVWACGGEITEK